MINGMLKEEAHKYVAKYYVNPTEMDFMIIYNAMLIASKIIMQEERKDIKTILDNTILG